MTKKYYEVLDLPENATESQIKKRFRELAMKYHPDKTGGDEKLAEKFKEVNEAYETLSDPQKKEAYDRYGDDGPQQGFPFPGFASMGGFPFAQFQQRRPQFPPLRLNKLFTLTELYDGGKFVEKIERFGMCSKCNGKGTDDGKEHSCKKCNGKGVYVKVVQQGNMIMQSQQNCDRCTHGIDPDAPKCKTCKGEVAIKEIIELAFEIKQGSFEGQKVVVPEMGNEIPVNERQFNQNRTRGDIIITINEKKHEFFERGFGVHGLKNPDPADLLYKMTITLAESLCGFAKRITHVSGADTRIRHSKCTRNGDIIVVPKQGMPRYNKEDELGDLYVLIDVEKGELSADIKSKIWQMLTNTPYHPVKDKKGYVDVISFEKHVETNTLKNNTYESDDDDNHANHFHEEEAPDCNVQ